MQKRNWTVTVFFVIGAAAFAGIITVDDDGPADYTRIQEAIDAAADGDIILVADGIYRGTGNRDIDFRGKAITVKSENGPENCVIDCEGTPDVPHRGFCFHLNEKMDSVLDGLTITGGYAVQRLSIFDLSIPKADWAMRLNESSGGGIYCSDASPTLINCIISGNTAAAADFQYGSNTYGGGIYCQGSIGPSLTRCIIKDNQAISCREQFINTHQRLDAAIQGEGYFVLQREGQNIYTRFGSFAVDSSCVLVDPKTGAAVQRIGSAGQAEGFQVSGDKNIYIPWDVLLPENIRLTGLFIESDGSIIGNFSDGIQRIIAVIQLALFQAPNALEPIDPIHFISTPASGDPLFTAPSCHGAGVLLGGYLENLKNPDDTPFFQRSLRFTGRPLDLAIEDENYYFVLRSGTGEVFTQIGRFDLNASETLVEPVRGYTVQRTGSIGEENGYQIPGDGDIHVSYDMRSPAKATSEISVRGNLCANPDQENGIQVVIYDSHGETHLLSAAFVRRELPNVWDFVIHSVSGETAPSAQRRIEGITFNDNGSYAGISGFPGRPSFDVQFPSAPGTFQTISLFFGTVGMFNGLRQFAFSSSAITAHQNGYGEGILSSVSVNYEGIIFGTFSNGAKSNLAKIKIATFTRPGALQTIDHGYFVPTSESGQAIDASALFNGEGMICGGALYYPQVNVSRHGNSFGGGLFSTAPVTLSNCLVINNSGDNGGGIYCQTGTLLENCTVSANYATYAGGGVYCSILTGPKPPYNVSLPLPVAEDTIIQNSILAGNFAEEGLQAALEAVEIWLTPVGMGESDFLFDPEFATLRIAYSDVQGGQSGILVPYANSLIWGTGNLDESPNFVHKENRHYRLHRSSPCINTGDPLFMPMDGETDLAGKPRIIGLRIDMGAYEFPNTKPAADAGEDQTVYAWVDGLAEVVLDGTGSSDADGDELAYFWYNEADQLVGEGATPQISLPVGEHAITLVVSDGIAESLPDVCVVTVAEAVEVKAKLAPPVVNRQSNRPYVIGRLELAGFSEADVDTAEAMVLMPGEIAAVRLVLVPAEGVDDVLQAVGLFDTAALVAVMERDGNTDITLAMRLTSGQWVYGRDTVKVFGAGKPESQTKQHSDTD